MSPIDHFDRTSASVFLSKRHHYRRCALANDSVRIERRALACRRLLVLVRGSRLPRPMSTYVLLFCPFGRPILFFCLLLNIPNVVCKDTHKALVCMVPCLGRIGVCCGWCRRAWKAGSRTEASPAHESPWPKWQDDGVARLGVVHIVLVLWTYVSK